MKLLKTFLGDALDTSTTPCSTSEPQHVHPIETQRTWNTKWVGHIAEHLRTVTACKIPVHEQRDLEAGMETLFC